jgi:hypothetical protein
MNTEPVQTTLRTIATWIAGTAVVTLTGMLALSELLKQLGMDPLADTLIFAVTTFVTAVVGVWKPLQAQSTLREQVTPWSPEIGATSPAPSEPVAGLPWAEMTDEEPEDPTLNTRGDAP